MAEQRRVTMAVTGAGGTHVAGHVLRGLVKDERVAHVDLMISANGRKVLAYECSCAETDDPVEQLLEGLSAEKITLWDPVSDVAGPHSSGSYPYWGMVVIPCALGVVGRIAQGQANTLIERAADVCLKERRQLVLCVRETPFNLIHLRNMTQATEAGAVIYPMIPTYYNAPQTVSEMREEFTARLLGFIGLDQTDYYNWTSEGTAARRDRARRG